VQTIHHEVPHDPFALDHRRPPPRLPPGVRRVSVGGAMARTAWGSFMRAAKAIAERGVFDGFAGAASGAELDRLFRTTTSDADDPD
jgi:hypothetical protein